MMRKRLLFLFFCGVICVPITAQTTIHLTFTAEVNGNHQPLDSVIIANLIQGGDTTLYGTDTVLVLDHGIGIGDRVSGHGNRMIIYPAFPNPVTHTSTIRLWIPQDGPVTLRLFDLPGRELATFNRTLGAGEHSFTFTPGRETFYLLLAEAADQRQVQKLISLSHGDGNSGITYTGHQPAPSAMRKGKSAFPWVPGDDLRFVGYASVGVDIIDDNPSQSAGFTFQFTHPGTPCPGWPTVTDINGNIYNTVQIGNQCWMKENLRVRTYRDGMPIPNVTNSSAWANTSTGARCWYNNDSASYAQTYGALYNWFAVDDSSGLCPAGWHVPTLAEWDTLIAHVGGEFIGGGALKATVLWDSPNTGATNSSGFTALPGGMRYNISASYGHINQRGTWWTSSPLGFPCAYRKSLWHDSISLGKGNAVFNLGVSVRCIKSQLRTETP